MWWRCALLYGTLFGSIGSIYVSSRLTTHRLEALIEVCKGFVPQGTQTPAWLWPAASCALGVVICVLAQVDAPALLGVTLSAPVVGYVVTGVLVSRGASFVHDLWARIHAGSTGTGD